MVMAENNITVEIRCKRCGKLLFKILKRFDTHKKSDIIVSKCNRCKNDNYIEI